MAQKKQLPLWVRFTISVIFDTIDCFIGRIPVLGTVFDIAGVGLGIWLWGPIGAAQIWEIVDISDQADGFVPTLTIAGLIIWIGGKTK